MARPKKDIDESLLEKLAMLHLSNTTIAHVLGVSTWTLDRRYAQLIAKAKSRAVSKIAEVLFDEAINQREAWALKLLAIRHLGYAEKPSGEDDNLSSNNIHKQVVDMINQIEYKNGVMDAKDKEISEENSKDDEE